MKRLSCHLHPWIAMGILMVVGCHKPPVAVPVPPPILPVVAIEDVPGPKEATATLIRGSNLGEIGENAYGSRDFASFLAEVNGIIDARRVEAGTVIQTPSVSKAFSEAKLNPHFQPAFNVLAKASTDFFGVLPSYLKAREESHVARGKFDVPPDIKATLESAAEATEAAMYNLAQGPFKTTAPRDSLEQFRGAAGLLRELASGTIDGYGFDYKMVGQRYGLGFAHAFVWSRNENR